MNKNYTWGVLLSGLLVLGSHSVRAENAAGASPEEQNKNAQFVETTFRSICQREADPASFNYYWNVLNEGSKTLADVKAAIEISCLRGAKADPCQHTIGSDLCQGSSN